MKQQATNSAPKVGSVSVAISALRLLARLREPRGVNAIARELGVSPSSCFNILKTLSAEGFVDFNLETKAYTLGSGIVDIARYALDPYNTFPLVRPSLEAIADRFSITCGLWMLTPTERLVLVGFAEAPSGLRIHLTVGQRLPMLLGAMGRCVAAHLKLPRPQLKRQFAKLHWQNPPDFKTYLAQVEEARSLGWSIDENCYAQGVTSVGAPIFDAQGILRYCVSSTMFSGQHTPEKMDQLAHEASSTAKACSERIFGTRPSG